ncbi:MAG: hypothetical protein HFJ27_03710 [Clostridia bacterium]|nr:hypothetical protein [Clostridia bacterium]
MRQMAFNPKLLSIYQALDKLASGFEVTGKKEQYKQELEFIYIKHLLYAGCGRFLEYTEGRHEIKKITQIMKQRYPNWRKNTYYQKQGFLFKLNCNVFYSHQLWLILLFQKLKACIKKGKI